MRRKRKQAEDSEAYHQEAAAAYLDALGVLWMHVPNEGRRSPVAGSRLKRQGLKRGVPDILIFTPTARHDGDGVHKTGCAIELKRPADRPKTLGRFERLTCAAVRPEQRDWLRRLMVEGYWSSWVCFGVQEVVEVCRWLGYDGSAAVRAMPQVLAK